MKEFKNNNFYVVFTSEKEFKVKNKFGDTYKCSLDENNKIVAKTAFGLKYATAARKQLGF